MIRLLIAGIDRLCLLGAWMGAIAVGLLAVMLIAEVIATSFLSFSQFYAVEYSGYFLGFSLVCGLGWTLTQGGHIRVGIVYERLSGRQLRWLDSACTVVALPISAFISAAVVQYAIDSIDRGSKSFYPSETPLVYPQALIAFGFCLLTLALLGRLLRLIDGRPVEDGEGPSLGGIH